MTPVNENSNEELVRQLAVLTAENARLKTTKKTTEGGMKVSEKGCASLYGLTGRFPASHYPEHWIKILARKDQILTFIRNHADELKWKKEGAKEAFLASVAEVDEKSVAVG